MNKLKNKTLRKSSYSKLFDKQTVGQAAAMMIIASILTKIVGFIRETVTASEFGISSEYDLFLTVFMIPSTIFAIFNYTISYSLTPYYHKLQVEKGEIYAEKYVNKLFFIGVVISSFFSILMILFSDYVISLFVIPSTESERILAMQLLPVLAWLLPLYIGSSILQTILQAEKYFMSSSMGPLLQNILIIFVLVIFSRSGIIFLAYAWVSGLIVWFILVSINYVFRRRNFVELLSVPPKLPLRLSTVLFTTGVQVILVEMWPQLYVVVDRVIIRFYNLPAGSIASLGYASNIYAMFLSLFVVSLGQAMFPFLSSHVTSGNKDELIRILTKSIRSVIVVTVPMVMVMYLLSHHIITFLFQRGSFDIAATTTTAAALKIYALELPFDSLYIILLGYFYSKRNFVSLIIAGIVSFITKLLLSLAFLLNWGYLGLAAATVIAISIRTGIIWIQLSKQKIDIISTREIKILLLKVLMSILPGLLISVYLIDPVSTFTMSVVESAMLNNLIIMVIVFVLLIFSYVLMISRVGVPEWDTFVVFTKKYLKLS